MNSKGVFAAILTAVLCISGNLLAYTDGDGSAENPYQIANKADLLELAADTGNYDKSFILTADIDLLTESFTGAVIAPDIDAATDGYQGPEFTGIFDGNGHTISHLTITATDKSCVGLFGYFSSGGQIKNLGVVNINIQGANRVGGLVGENYEGIITSCYATGSVSGTDYGGIGGLVGGNYGPITSSYATAAVSGKAGIGGLVGEGGGAITSCYATGSVNGTGDNVGGLAGYNEGPINSCYAIGAVSGTGWHVGGLVGYNNSYGSVTSCFWDVNTSGQSNSSGGKGLNPDQMETVTIYQNAGWADKDWVMNDGFDYPRLSWEGTGYAAIPSAVIPFAGSGTETDPYRITTAQEFASLSGYSIVLDKQIKLEANLDLNGITLYPIGDLGAFTGVFDGNSHTISNATILQPGSDYVGLFAYLGNSGQIKNFGVDNANIQGNDKVGGLVGYSDGGTITSCYSSGWVSGVSLVGGLVGYNAYGTIESCYATGAVNETHPYSAVGGLVGANEGGTLTSCDAAVAVSGTGYYVGGLVGDSANGTITSCYATGTVNGANSNVGGLVGHSNQGTITSCYATGAVNGTGSYGVGGLVGTPNYSLITLCYATGTVSGNYLTGGLVGENSYGTIESCYSTGAVSGGRYVGGLVGSNAGTIASCYSMGAVNGASGTDYVGGLVGYNSPGNITSCYATGLVNGTGLHIGGLVGHTFYGSVTSCFWDSDSTGQTTSAGGIGKTTAEMKTLSTFTGAGWDFVGVWTLCEGTNYPRLKWQILPTDWVCPDRTGFEDFAYLAARWLRMDCATTDRCEAADLNDSGTVDLIDLALFSESWLAT